MWTLSQFIMISFSLYLHWTYTYVCTTYWINTSQWNTNKGNGRKVTDKLQITSSIQQHVIKIILYLRLRYAEWVLRIIHLKIYITLNLILTRIRNTFSNIFVLLQQLNDLLIFYNKSHNSCQCKTSDFHTITFAQQWM